MMPHACLLAQCATQWWAKRLISLSFVPFPAKAHHIGMLAPRTTNHHCPAKTVSCLSYRSGTPRNESWNISQDPQLVNSMSSNRRFRLCRHSLDQQALCLWIVSSKCFPTRQAGTASSQQTPSLDFVFRNFCGFSFSTTILAAHTVNPKDRFCLKDEDNHVLD